MILELLLLSVYTPLCKHPWRHNWTREISTAFHSSRDHCALLPLSYYPWRSSQQLSKVLLLALSGRWFLCVHYSSLACTVRHLIPTPDDWTSASAKLYTHRWIKHFNQIILAYQCSTNLRTKAMFSCEVIHASVLRNLGGNLACGRVFYLGCQCI